MDDRDCGSRYWTYRGLRLVPDWRPILTFVAPVIGGAAALLAAFNAIEARRDASTADRVHRALEEVHRWNDPMFFHVKDSGRQVLEHFREKKKVDEEFLKADSKRISNLMDILNFFECLGLSVRQKVIDEDTANRFFRTILIQYWHVSQDWIKKRRAERDNPRLLREMEWLFKEWQKLD